MSWFSPAHSHLPMGRWHKKKVSTLFWTVFMGRYSVSRWKRKKEMVSIVRVWVDSHLPIGRWSRKNVSCLFWTVLMGRYSVSWWKRKKEMVSIVRVWVDSHLPILTYPWAGGAEKTFHVSFELYWWEGTVYLGERERKKWFPSWEYELILTCPFSPTHGQVAQKKGFNSLLDCIYG